MEKPWFPKKQYLRFWWIFIVSMLMYSLGQSYIVQLCWISPALFILLLFCLPLRLPIAATVPEKCRNDRPFPCPVSGRSASVSALNSSPAGTLPKSPPKTLISSGWKTCNVGFLGYFLGICDGSELIFFLLCFPFNISLKFLIAMWLWFQTMVHHRSTKRGNLPADFAGNFAVFSRVHRDDTNFVSCCIMF